MNTVTQEFENFHLFQLDELSYQVRPLNIQDPTHLRCIVSVTNNNGYQYLDKLDLYQASARRMFIKKSVSRVETSAQMLEYHLTTLVHELESLRDKEEQIECPIELPPIQKKQAAEYLQDPDLVNNIIESFHTCGYVGEDLNLLTAYLAATSRKLRTPLNLMIMSRSGAGKSTLQDAILKTMPEEEYQLYTRLTDQVLYYKGKDELRHKLIAIEEEQGMRGAAYSLRNLLSSHGLSVNATIRDPLTGMMKAQSHTVHGPVAIMLTTTALDEIDYELQNRFIIVTIDESVGQTERILKKQRHSKSLEGLILRRNQQNEYIILQNIQRLLKPIEIVNPFHNQMTFDHTSLIMRRRHMQYLGIIDAVTLLHQYQRPVKKCQDKQGEFEYIEVTKRDIEIANKVAEKILPASGDELVPPARNLHQELILFEVEKNKNNGSHPVAMRRKDIRDHTGWNDYQIRKYLKQLVDLEYVGLTGGGKGNSCSYELLYRGNGNKPITLIDPNQLEENS